MLDLPPINPPLLIGLTGRAGSGKSTAAAFLEDEYGFAHIAFADPIVDMIGALFNTAGIDGAWMAERALKEQPTTLGFSYRHLAQTLGTEWGRNTVAPDFWLRVATLRVRELLRTGDNVVISDVRFPNEADWLLAQGGVLVRLQRDDAAAVRPHESEAHADALAVDATVLNNGSQIALYDQIDVLMHGLRATPIR